MKNYLWFGLASFLWLLLIIFGYSAVNRSVHSNSLREVIFVGVLIVTIVLGFGPIVIVKKYPKKFDDND
jgi:hypothetical protein